MWLAGCKPRKWRVTPHRDLSQCKGRKTLFKKTAPKKLLLISSSRIANQQSLFQSTWIGSIVEPRPKICCNMSVQVVKIHDSDGAKIYGPLHETNSTINITWVQSTVRT